MLSYQKSVPSLNTTAAICHCRMPFCHFPVAFYCFEILRDTCHPLISVQLRKVSMLLFFIISSVLIALNLNIILWDLNDHALLLFVPLQVLVATRKCSGWVSEVNVQMLPRNLKIFCLHSINRWEFKKNISFCFQPASRRIIKFDDNSI